MRRWATFLVCALVRRCFWLRKIYFPREVFPLGTVAGAVVDFGFSLVIFVPVYAWYAVNDPHVEPSGKLLFSDAADVFRSSPDGLQEIRAHLRFGSADFFSRSPNSGSREVQIIQF